MTLKELSQLYYLNREIEADQKHLEELRTLAIGGGAGRITDMPKVAGGTDSKFERYIADIIDLQSIINAKQQQCMHERNRLMRYISDIPDSLTRQIFTLRFVSGLSWRQVAFSIGGGNNEKSVSKVCYRHIEKHEK